MQNLWSECIQFFNHAGVFFESDITEIDIILGVLDYTDDSILMNHLILLVKYHIFSCKLKDRLPYKSDFVVRLKTVYRSELCIAREKDKLNYHFTFLRPYNFGFIILFASRLVNTVP